MYHFADRNTDDYRCFIDHDHERHTHEWPDENRVTMVWTTSALTWNIRMQRTIESIFHSYPGAYLQMMTNTLPTYFFHRFVRAGYNISVIRYDVRAILEHTGAPGKVWFDNLEKWSHGTHFYAHFADFVRFLVLYQQGGLYSDTDSLLLRPLHIWPPIALGTEECDSDGLTFCLRRQGENTKRFYLPIGVLLLPAAHSLMHRALSLFDSSYNPAIWPCGTAFLTQAFHNFSLEEDPQADRYLLPKEKFYPIPWQNVSYYLSAKSVAHLQDSYAVHFWNKVTRTQDIRQGSTFDDLFASVSISERRQCPLETFGPFCKSCATCNQIGTRRCSTGILGRGCICTYQYTGLTCSQKVHLGHDFLAADIELSPAELSAQWQGPGTEATITDGAVVIFVTGNTFNRYALRSFQIKEQHLCYAASACLTLHGEVNVESMDLALLVDVFSESGSETFFELFPILSAPADNLCVDLSIRHARPITWINLYLMSKIANVPTKFHSVKLFEVIA